jgi:uncharacterized protein
MNSLFAQPHKLNQGVAASGVPPTHQHHADDLLAAFEHCKVRRSRSDMLICLSNAERGGMEYNLPLNGSMDLDALDDFLMSDHAPDDGMGLSDLDGFLTGIVVGPELILPSEWLPVIWGGEEPEFETEAEMRTILGTIMGRYNEIAACFNSDPDEFYPIFWEGPEGEVIASVWAGGFLDAVALRPKAWEPLIESDNAGILMAPLLLLNGDVEIADSPANENELLAEASDMIPTCIAGIHEFWRNYQKPQSGRGQSRPGGRRRQ